VAAGVPIKVPHAYYPDDDPTRQPLNRWRSHAHLLFGNWITQVYRTTPYDIGNIGKKLQPLAV
jgi:homoserine O-succinyltransferase